jgi:hypothetical protein
MKEKEIEQKLLNGDSLKIHFGIRSVSFQIGEKRITKNQFDKARDKFKDKLAFKADYSALTKHFYFLKKL